MTAYLPAGYEMTGSRLPLFNYFASFPESSF
jgi:hypothetical protein